jgi:hypothetical protein
MAKRRLCIHGHFYQPPREDPFTGEVPIEPGAEPFPNFNEKITAECYLPNAEIGNFDLLSFDLGPTLSSWLERFKPNALLRIIKADRRNTEIHGLGNSIAHPYYHIILPLAKRDDKETQVIWGIREFLHRFGRRPSGMWLPEMAVDYETLDVLSACGIAFTILSSSQAIGDIEDAGPWWVRLSKGRIAVFFRDEETSNRIAFDIRATEDAGRFAKLYLADKRSGFLLLALDGETFGHHQKGRERFLHDLLRKEAKQASYEITFLAKCLMDNPPRDEINIIEGSSWSCEHGLSRWSDGCGCTAGDSGWKPVLRLAMDDLAEEIDAIYLDETRMRVADPLRLRKDYILVMLGEMKGEALLAEHAVAKLRKAEEELLLSLLEAQRYRQAMYTSCGFFRGDLDSLELRYSIAYAAKAIQLVRKATGVSLEEGFTMQLSRAVSYITNRTGEDIYNEVVSKSDIELGKKI